MSTRIERAWGVFTGQTAVKRKESADQDGSSKQQKKEQPPKKDEGEGEDRPADRKAVDKAVDDLRSAGDFSQTGMKVEAYETKDGLRIKLAHANGTTVKVMTAEEFLKLREGSVVSGKILDQKY